MKGRVGMMVGAVSLLSVGVLFAQQPQGKSDAKPAAAATQPAVQQAQGAPQNQAQTSSKTAAKAKTAASKWTKEQITEAQEGLKRAKLYSGPANGVLGRETRRAIRTFQRQHKLTVNGQLSDSLLDMLKTTPQ
jgi:peptidoglycan hydrolase-like protein with peptidoglycan-binding domain